MTIGTLTFLVSQRRLAMDFLEVHGLAHRALASKFKLTSKLSRFSLDKQGLFSLRLLFLRATFKPVGVVINIALGPGVRGSIPVRSNCHQQRLFFGTASPKPRKYPF